MTLLLAGDIGGTKTILRLVEEKAEGIMAHSVRGALSQPRLS
jgi:glucokinase